MNTLNIPLTQRFYKNNVMLDYGDFSRDRMNDENDENIHKLTLVLQSTKDKHLKLNTVLNIGTYNLTYVHFRKDSVGIYILSSSSSL